MPGVTPAPSASESPDCVSASRSFASNVPEIGRPESRSEEHTSELQSLTNLVCRLLLEKKKIDRPSSQGQRTSERPRALEQRFKLRKVEQEVRHDQDMHKKSARVVT